MGGFFVSNDAVALDAARRVFASKPVGSVATERRVGDAAILAWGKARGEQGAALHQSADGWLLGFGTYYSRTKFGPTCLPELWEELQRHGFKAFGDLRGHFAFAVCRDDKLHVVTDKTGIYHVHVASHGTRFYLSSSLLAIAESLPKVTLARQELLEFVNVETTFGGRTLFEEIEHAPGGVVIECKPGLPDQTYYEPHDEAVTFDAFVERLDDYLRVFRTPDAKPCADLSGGHDSRTVVAALAHAGVDFDCNTNVNRTDRHDHETAERVARHLGRPLRIFQNQPHGGDLDRLVDDCFAALELARSLHNAANTPLLFREKSAQFPLIFGGYGGELLRDKYSRARSLEQLVRERYVSSRIWLPPDVDRAYRETLIAKFERTLQALGERDAKKGVEKIYFFEKMRYWGGSRITAFNQYCYRAHPLLDHTLARHSFDFSLDDKAHAGLQKRVMALVPGLDRIPLAHDLAMNARGRAAYWLRTELQHRNLGLSPDLTRWARHLRRRVQPYEAPDRVRPALAKIRPELLSFASLSLGEMADPLLLNRLATVGYAVDRLGGKVAGL
jgi:asparagine synthetase B (glutamine-hydrolysing)